MVRSIGRVWSFAALARHLLVQCLARRPRWKPQPRAARKPRLSFEPLSFEPRVLTTEALGTLGAPILFGGLVGKLPKFEPIASVDLGAANARELSGWAVAGAPPSVGALEAPDEGERASTPPLQFASESPPRKSKFDDEEENEGYSPPGWWSVSVDLDLNVEGGDEENSPYLPNWTGPHLPAPWTEADNSGIGIAPQGEGPKAGTEQPESAREPSPTPNGAVAPNGDAAAATLDATPRSDDESVRKSKAWQDSGTPVDPFEAPETLSLQSIVVPSLGPGLVISEFLADPAGTDSPFEYVELRATRDIDFSATPFSVVFADTNVLTTGWASGGFSTYGFEISTGFVAQGSVVYVGGTSMAPVGVKLRTINTGTTPGDGFGVGRVSGVLGDGGDDSDGIAVFDGPISGISSSTVPVDAVLFGLDLGLAASSGYQLPDNDLYDGGIADSGTPFVFHPPGTNVVLHANGTFNAVTGTWFTGRTWSYSTAWTPGSLISILGSGTGASVSISAVSADTGSSSADRITNDTSLTLSGTAPASMAVTVYRGDGSEVGTTTSSGSRTWSLADPSILGDGVQRYLATVKYGGALAGVSDEFRVTVDTIAPSVAASIATQVYDTTPVVRVTASDLNGVVPTVTLDVDLNNDGSFAGGELGYATGTLSGGAADIELPALAFGTYAVRARVADVAGNAGTSSTAPFAVVPTPTSYPTTSPYGPGTTSFGTLDATGRELAAGNVRVEVHLDLDLSPSTCGCQDAALVYNSESVNVRPTVAVDVLSDNAMALPPSIVAALTWNGTVVATTTYSTAGRSPGELFHLALQVPTAISTTGRHLWSVQVTMDYTSLPDIVRNVSGATYTAPQDDSPYGSGWTFSNVDRLFPIAAGGGYPAGVLRTFGKGGWAFYESTGGSSYASPPGDNGILAASGGGWTYTSPNGAVRTFNSSGMMTAWVSGSGFETFSYTYTDADADGDVDDVSTMTVPDGAVANFVYSGGKLTDVTVSGRNYDFLHTGDELTLVTDPAGGLHSYGYDGDGYVASSAFGSQTQSWDYENGMLSSFQLGGDAPTMVAPALSRGLGSSSPYVSPTGARDGAVSKPSGGLWRSNFDSYGNVTQTVSPAGAVSLAERDPATGWVVGNTDPLGRSTEYTRDSLGYVTRIERPDGSATTFAYQTAFHAQTGETDALGRTTQYTYDVYGQVRTVTDPAGGVTTYTWSSGLVQTAVDPLGRTTSYVYDANRRLSAEVDALGRRTTYAYDANGNPRTVKDPLNRTTTYLYDAVGRLLSTTDPTGAIATTVYDAGGMAIASVDPLGRRTTYAYDAAGRQTSMQDPTGARTTSLYDVDGRLWASIDPLGRRTTFSYDGDDRQVAVQNPVGIATTVYDLAGQVAASLDPTGVKTRYSYDANGRLVAVIDGTGGVSTTVYDAAGQVRATVDPLGNRTSYAYDATGRTVAVTDALNGVATTVYNLAGEVTASVDPLGRRTSHAYDLVGRTTAVRNPLNQATTTIYDAAGQVSAVQDPLNRRTSYTYDAAGRTVAVKDPTGAVGTTVYDVAGQVTASVDPLGRRTTYSYDGAGRTLAVQDPTGAVASTVYDVAGQVTASVDPLGRRTTYSYDQAGRTTLVRTADGQVWQTQYDAAGRVIASLDPLHRLTRYGFDAAGRTVTTTDPLGGVATTAYDLAGNVAASVDPLGQRTTFSYDALNRNVDARDAVGVLGTTVYDAASQVTATVDPLGRRTSYAYDAAGRTTAVRNPLNQATTTIYDAAGQVTAVQDPLNRRTSYTYDGAGRTLTVKDPTGAVASTVYDAAGQVTAAVDPLGRRTTFAYDFAGRTLTVQDPTGAIGSTVYDAAGQVTAAVDPLGRRTTFAYDAVGRTVSATDALGGIATTVYDAVGNAVASVDPLGRRTTFAYDALDRLVTTKNPFLHVATTVYDAAGQVLATVDPLGRRTTFAYDARGRSVQVTDPIGGLATTVYDAADQVTATLDPLGRRTSYTYDAAGRTTEVRNPLNQVASTVYDAAGQVTAAVNPLGRRTTHTYDGAGRQTSVRNPLNQLATTVYDAAGQVLAAVDGRGNRTTFTYDGAGRLRTATDALGGVATTGYDAVGNATTSVDPRGSTTTVAYDALNRPVAVTDPLGFAVTTVYDAVGNATVGIDELGRRTTTTYDALDRAIAVQNPRGYTTTTAYDAVGNVRAVTDPLNHTTSYVYDVLDRLVATADPLAKATTFVYDAASNRTAVVDPNGNRTTFAYDAADRVVTEQLPTGSVTTMVYNAAGWMTDKIDPTGRRTSLAYDLAGRPTGEVWHEAGGTVANVLTFAYDAAGNATAAADPDGVYTYAFDALNRPSAVAGPFGQVLTFAYDAAGNRTRVEDQFGGVTTSTYDAAGQLTARTVGGTSAVARVDYAYDGAGQVGTMVYASDLAGSTVVAKTTYAYDASGNNTRITETNAGGAVLASYAYVYDNADRLTSRTDNGSFTSYVYDNADQLTRDGAATFGYDANGNRNGPGYVVGAGNRVTTDGTYTYTYDAAGAVVGKADGSGNLWTYAYDHWGHLTGASYKPGGGPASQVLTYAYDAYGNLLRRDFWNGATTATAKYGYDGGDTAKPGALANENFDAWAELDASNALATRRVYGPGFDDAVARVTGGAVNWYGTDRQGSVRQVFDNSGTVLATTAFDAYGKLTSGVLSDSVGYTGGTYDPVTGLTLLGDRVYDANAGTWMTHDRMGFEAGDANLRRYVGNGPSNGTDPSGMEEVPKPREAKQIEISFDRDKIDKDYVFGQIKAGRAIAEREDWLRKNFWTVNVAKKGQLEKCENRSSEVTGSYVYYAEVTDDRMVHTLILEPVNERVWGTGRDVKLATKHFRVVKESHLSGPTGEPLAAMRARFTSQDFGRNVLSRFREARKLNLDAGIQEEGFGALEAALNLGLNFLPFGSTAQVLYEGKGWGNINGVDLAGDVASLAGGIGVLLKGSRVVSTARKGKILFYSSQAVDGGLALYRGGQALGEYADGNTAAGNRYLTETFLRLAGITIKQVAWRAAKGKPFVVSDSKPPAIVGKNSLVKQEASAIQRVADKYKIDIYIGGSRAQGKGRNVDRPDLPAGDKGPDTRSDIDYIFDKSHPQAKDIHKDLQAVGNAGEPHPHMSARGPYRPEESITPDKDLWRFKFSPGARPQVIPTIRK